LNALRNTFFISGLKLFIGFPIPIIIALLLNEISRHRVKKVYLTLIYLPYFISWVVLAGIFLRIFSPEGPVNYLRGLVGESPILFFAIPKYFLSLVVGTAIWREMGWSSVVYLAALSSIDPDLYEAAEIDGAGRLRQTLHITIPSLLPVAAILLILNTGFILNAGFDQIYNLFNPLVLEVGEIIDTFVFKKGIVEFNYSYGAAVGFFKSLVGLILIYISNRVAVALGGKESSLW
jgi:putative aldouronate transport system permease protein